MKTKIIDFSRYVIKRLPKNDTPESKRKRKDWAWEKIKKRFPCEMCRYFLKGENNPMWDKKPVLCYAKHPIAFYWPRGGPKWDDIVGELVTSCGYFPVEGLPCKDFIEYE